MSERSNKIEFGDFQTPLPLAEAVCALLKRQGVCPRTVVEPSCGEGAFLEAAARNFRDGSGLFLASTSMRSTSKRANRRLAKCYPNASVQCRSQDFFAFDWEAFLKDRETPILFVGNPPWVTNAALGVLGADNLPEKSNLKRLSGLSARTGKANFDISEWMLLKLATAAKGRDFSIAMLCKTGVARKALEYCWKSGMAPAESALYRINALEWFGAAVDACLLVARFAPGEATETSASLYASLDSVCAADTLRACGRGDGFRCGRLSAGEAFERRQLLSLAVGREA